MLLPLLLPLELSPVQPAEIPCISKRHGIHQASWWEAVPKPHGEPRRQVCISIWFMATSTCDWFIMPANFLWPHPLTVGNHKPLLLYLLTIPQIFFLSCSGHHWLETTKLFRSPRSLTLATTVDSLDYIPNLLSTPDPPVDPLPQCLPHLLIQWPLSSLCWKLREHRAAIGPPAPVIGLKIQSPLGQRVPLVTIVLGVLTDLSTESDTQYMLILVCWRK